jgi:TonB family protein
MRVVVKARPRQSEPELRLLSPETSRWQNLADNLVALIRSFAAPPGRDYRTVRHPVVEVVMVSRWDPRRAMSASLMCHIAAAAMLLNITFVWRYIDQRDPEKQAKFDSSRLEWYRVANQLPSIGDNSPKQPQERGGKRREPARRGATVRHVQKIVSNPAEPDNSEQTIVQPDAPNIKIAQTIKLPNVVTWNEAEKPLPPVNLVRAPLRMPAELIKHTVEMPEDMPNSERRLADFKAASLPVTTAAPKLAVDPGTTAAGNTPPAAEPLPPPPDAGAIGSSADAAARLRRLVVVNANPAPPGGPLDVPAGNRAGAFSAGPEGVSGTPNGSATGNPEGGAGGPAPAGDGSLGGGRDLGGIHIPGLSVAGGPRATGPVVAGPAPPSVSRAPLPAAPVSVSADPRAMIARPTRATLPDFNMSRRPPDPDFRPGNRIYTVFINMPNLSSGGGGSWLMRFAEIEQRPPGDSIEITAPVATHKIDPGYSPDAVREKVEGKVRLHAVIRRDGHVERVEVLRSLDPRLDQRAVEAMVRWVFSPALRQGIPVDLEAVIEIPFVLPAVSK